MVPLPKVVQRASTRDEILITTNEITSAKDGVSSMADENMLPADSEMYSKTSQVEMVYQSKNWEEKISSDNVESSDSEEDELFTDAIDNYDFYVNLEEENTVEKEYLTSEKKYTTLKELVAGTDFSKPPTVPVSKTIGEIIIMIVRYAFINSLSLTATYQVFFLINSIFETPILPNTKYFIDKLFYPKKWANFHAIYIECGRYAGMFEPRKDRYVTCRVCNNRSNVKEYANKNFFISMDPSSPISELIQSNSEYYNFIVNERVYNKKSISDIYDGKLYRNFKKSLNAAEKHQYATITFNTDGAPLFENSNCSIWPIYLMVNELPYNVISKELVLAGLWFGKDKPQMNSFLAPFVENMNRLSKEEIQCNVNGSLRCIKIFPLVCCLVSVARAPLQGFVQFNDQYGCGYCLHPGKWVRNSSKSRSGGCMKYPLLCSTPENRNLVDTILNAEKATPEHPVSGVKSRSCLMDLLKFDFNSWLCDRQHARMYWSSKAVCEIIVWNKIKSWINVPPINTGN